MAAPEQSPNELMSAAFAKKNIIPIARLDVSRLPGPESYIEATIALQWPYSSLTGVSAFLLAEQDFRLRRTGGQVRWELTGPSASSLSAIGIEIGDVVRLDLNGLTWVDNPQNLNIPGQCVERTLRSDWKLAIQVG